MGALVVPQLASAAWWNPMTWFEGSKSEPVTPVNTDEQTEEVQTNTKSASSNVLPPVETKVIEKQVIKEIPVEKVIEKVVTKSDQAVIDENNLLKSKIKNLETQILGYAKEINSLKAKIQELEVPLTQAENRRKELNTQIAKIDVGLVTLEVNGIENKAGPNYYTITFCSESGSTSSSCSTKEYTYNELKILKAKLQAELASL